MQIVIHGPDGSLKQVKLKNHPISIGRSTDNDFAYPNDLWLSRYHLRFERNGSGWTVKDCKSRNGTVVNNNSLRAKSFTISTGDRIYAGHLTIDVHDTRETSKRVVAFVPQGRELLDRKSTIVTNLDQVLSKTSAEGALKGTALSNSQAVRALIRAGQELAGHRPLDQVFSVILDLALSAVSAARGVILALENGELEVRASKGDDFSISTMVRDRIIREKCSFMISDAQLDAAFREQKSIVAHRVHSMMAVPLQTGDRVIGLLYVDTGSLIRPFVQEDLDLLTVMANVAAIRIEHARLALIEQSEKLLESELAQASEIQKSLLPREIPECPGYDLAGLNLPCYSVGGDYYDFLPYEDGRLGIVVGDVAGKGMAAALMMSSLQARVQMLAESQVDPAAALLALNRKIGSRFPPGRFITFFYGLLDPASGQVEYANAGHNYPFLVRADGSVRHLTGHEMVLGIFEATVYNRYRQAVEPGDLLALFSDGVTEARNAEQIEFGEERLAAFLADRHHLPLKEIIRDLVEEVRQWTGQTSFADDFTMVLVRRQAYESDTDSTNSPSVL